MTKPELRKLYLQKRCNLTDADYADLNHQLCDKFFSKIDLSNVKVLHTFLPILRNKEPDTGLIIDRIKKEFPHIRLSIPKVNMKTNLFENFYIEDQQTLHLNTWGIPEPEQGFATESNEIDMVIVPLLAYDTSGHRVGYGKGFYDRFLSLCRTDCKKIGLSFFTPVEKIDDVDTYDQLLDVTVTPDQAFIFKP